MPTESELRALLHGQPGGSARLDAQQIIRVARARRRPRQIAAGALGGLAALALVVPVVAGLGALGPRGASDSGVAAPAESAESFTSHGDGGSLASDPYPGCRLPTWDGEPVPSGVALHVNQSAAGGPLELILSNGSDSVLSGRLAGSPLVTLSDGDEPLGWSAAAVTAAANSERIVLAPGEQRSFPVPLDVDSCSGEPLSGTVDAEAALAIVLDDGATVVASSERGPIVVAPAE